MALDDATGTPLYDLFLHQLQTVYFVEQELVDALEELAASASTGVIQDLFAEHGAETVDHVQRLEEVFDALDEPPEAAESPLLHGVESDRDTFENMFTDDDQRDVYYLGAGSVTERIEITLYEEMLTLADALGLPTEVTVLLEQNLEEEYEALDDLHELASDSAILSILDRLTA